MALSKLIRGDDWKFTFAVLTPQGNVQDITGGSIWLTFKDDTTLGQGDASAQFQVANLDIQDADDTENNVAQGVVVLRAAWDSAGANPPDNTMLAPGKYNYDVQYKAPTGEITTIDSGTVTVSRQVTDAT